MAARVVVIVVPVRVEHVFVGLFGAPRSFETPGFGLALLKLSFFDPVFVCLCLLLVGFFLFFFAEPFAPELLQVLLLRRELNWKWLASADWLCKDAVNQRSVSLLVKSRDKRGFAGQVRGETAVKSERAHSSKCLALREERSPGVASLHS